MKKCEQCGKLFPDDSIVCSYCGVPLVDDVPNDGTNNENSTNNYNPILPKQNQYHTPYPKDRYKKPRKKLSKKGKRNIVLSIIALILVIVLIVCSELNVFNLFYGPLNNICKAYSNTIVTGSSSITGKIGYSDQYKNHIDVDYTISYDIDYENEDITALVDLTYKETNKSYKFVKDSKMDVNIAIYNKHCVTELIYYDESNNIEDTEYRKIDCEDYIKSFFSYYNSYLTKSNEYLSIKGFDWEKYFNDLANQIAQIQGDDEIKQQILDLYREITTKIDFDELTKTCYKTYLTINDKKWLKDNVGYKSSRSNGIKTHSFNITNFHFLTKMPPIFKDCFYNPSDYASFSSDIIEFSNMLSDELGGGLNLSIGVKDKKLNNIEFNYNASGESLTFDANFANYNNSQLNTSQLEEMYNKAVDI